ncbi:MAG TPA: hypothetical protein VED84_04350 [Acidimicrobiales bacterium]|nr:hypothetical protein [Acidimicrobiales bacterium]
MVVEELGPEDAGPVLKRYLHKVRVTARYFDAKDSDPVHRFADEATRHPVFRLSGDPEPS